MKIGGEPIRRWCEIAYLEPIHRCCTFVSMMKIGTWRTNHEMKISGGRSDSRKWTDHRVNWRRTTLVSEVFLETFLRERESEQPSGDNESRRGEEREKNPSLSSSLRDLLSARNDGSLALSRRNISRKTSGPRVAANQFADDLKIVVQVVHTDGQGHSHRRFRGRLCFSLTACRTLKIVLRALRTYR